MSDVTEGVDGGGVEGDVISTEKTRHGSYDEQLASLQSGLRMLLALGSGDSTTYESIIVQFLKKVENLKISTEAEIQKLRRQIARLQSTYQVAGVFSDIILEMVEMHRQNALSEVLQTQELITSYVQEEQDEKAKEIALELQARLSKGHKELERRGIALHSAMDEKVAKAIAKAMRGPEPEVPKLQPVPEPPPAEVEDEPSPDPPASPKPAAKKPSPKSSGPTSGSRRINVGRKKKS